MHPAIIGAIAGLVGKYITNEQAKSKKKNEIFAQNLEVADALFLEMIKLLSERLFLSQSLFYHCKDASKKTQEEVKLIYENYRKVVVEYNTDRVVYEVRLRQYFGEASSQIFIQEIHGYTAEPKEKSVGFLQLHRLLKQGFKEWETGQTVSEELSKNFKTVLESLSNTITSFYHRLEHLIKTHKIGDRAPDNSNNSQKEWSWFD